MLDTNEKSDTVLWLVAAVLLLGQQRASEHSLRASLSHHTAAGSSSAQAPWCFSASVHQDPTTNTAHPVNIHEAGCTWVTFTDDSAAACNGPSQSGICMYGSLVWMYLIMC